MIKNLYNKNRIVSIRIYGKKVVNSFEYREGNLNSIWSFFGKREPGFYDTFTGQPISPEEIKHLIVDYENKVLYYRPYVRISFSNGEATNRYFHTPQECIDYVKFLLEEHKLSDEMISFS